MIESAEDRRDNSHIDPVASTQRDDVLDFVAATNPTPEQLQAAAVVFPTEPSAEALRVGELVGTSDSLTRKMIDDVRRRHIDPLVRPATGSQAE